MSGLTFDFCATRRVIEEIPPSDAAVKSMNGWPYAPRPRLPFQRTFTCKLHGLRWYQNNVTQALDITTDSPHNAGRLQAFYRQHRLHDSFLLNHEYLGVIRVRFNKPVAVPAGKEGAFGTLDPLEVEFIEHEPTY